MPRNFIQHIAFCLVFLGFTIGFAIAPMHISSFNLTMSEVKAEAKKKTSTTKKKSSTRVKKTYGTKKTAIKKSSARQVSVVQKQVPQDETDRWAAIVVDANEGRILYEKNADEERHPASLTKMMTLYLLFEALEGKRYKMTSLLDVSDKAADQPPTNISLAPGDSISVETAILALIIRSANDVAMVVAENIGGSQDGFARMMNRKAKELGMNDSRFYNPSGLPDDRQISTASDLARLGIALRRDFPQYYPYFKRAAFDYNGRTYTTHNRVVGRYPGADGLKTGYIRASGFNLVTSVTRGSTRLVGVVMGGTTASSRDQEMMNMLDRTIFAMNRTGASKSYASLNGAKKPEKKKHEEHEAAMNAVLEQPAPELQVATQEAHDEYEGALEPSTVPTDQVEAPIEEVIEPKAPIEPKYKPETQNPQMLDRKPIPQLPPVKMQTLANTIPPSFVSERNWAIQVGAYPTLDQAERAAKNAKAIAGNVLSKAQMQISQVTKDGRVYNRSRMIYLSSDEAKNACDHLISSNKVCMIVRMEN